VLCYYIGNNGRDFAIPSLLQRELSRSIYFYKAPLCKGSSREAGEGLFLLSFLIIFKLTVHAYNPSAFCCAKPTSLCTREAIKEGGACTVPAPFAGGRLMKSVQMFLLSLLESPSPNLSLPSGGDSLRELPRRCQLSIAMLTEGLSKHVLCIPFTEETQ